MNDDTLRDIAIEQGASDTDMQAVAVRTAKAALALKHLAPVDMVLHCPACGLQHIDAPELNPYRNAEHYGAAPEPKWINPPHRSHLCHGCGHIWRPADVPTNGVAAVTTKGKADSPIAPPPVQAREQAKAGGLPLRDASKSAEKQGLFRKFEVSRTDGSDAPGGKHDGCNYFVLDVDHDACAQSALAAYADAVEASHPLLAADMREHYKLAHPPAEQAKAEMPAEQFGIVRAICRFALVYPNEALTHQIERLIEATGGEQKRTLSNLLRSAMKPQPPARRLVFSGSSVDAPPAEQAKPSAGGEAAEIAEWLKDGETVLQRLERERADVLAVTGLLAKDREQLNKCRELLSSARAIAERKGTGTAWERFAASVAALGISGITARTYRVLEDDEPTHSQAERHASVPEVKLEYCASCRAVRTTRCTGPCDECGCVRFDPATPTPSQGAAPDGVKL